MGGFNSQNKQDQTPSRANQDTYTMIRMLEGCLPQLLRVSSETFYKFHRMHKWQKDAYFSKVFESEVFPLSELDETKVDTQFDDKLGTFNGRWMQTTFGLYKFYEVQPKPVLSSKPQQLGVY
jgi:hypothetical protein